MRERILENPPDDGNTALASHAVNISALAELVVSALAELVVSALQGRDAGKALVLAMQLARHLREDAAHGRVPRD